METMGQETGRRVGYARSTFKGESLEQQAHALNHAGVAPEDLYTDIDAVEASASRPGLEAAVASLMPHDSLIVTSLDRLAHSTQALLRLATDIRSKGASIEALDLGPETPSPTGSGDTELMRVLRVLGDMENSLQKERMNFSVRRRRAKGADLGGRRAGHSDEEILAAAEKIKGGASKLSVAKEMGIPRATLYRRISALGLDIS